MSYPFNRRFYTTEDMDLELDLRVSGYPMASILSGTAREFSVSACDPSGDTFKEVRLYRNGNLIQTLVVSGSYINVVFSDTGFVFPAYYYVIVQQNDEIDSNGRNDEAITSLIWI